MAAAKTGLLIASCVALVAAVLGGRYVLRDDFMPPPATALRPADQAALHPRIWYRQSSLPRLALPGGEYRTVSSVLNVAKAMQFGDFVWNEDAIPAGPVWVRIDLGNQLMSVFRGEHEIGSAVILYGTDGKPTPTGTFNVLAKDADYHSITYDAPMPFMLRLTADGVAIHASNVREGSATHGCIGVPPEFARRLFAQVQLGNFVAILPVGADGTKPATPSN